MGKYIYALLGKVAAFAAGVWVGYSQSAPIDCIRQRIDPPEIRLQLPSDRYDPNHPTDCMYECDNIRDGGPCSIERLLDDKQ